MYSLDLYHHYRKALGISIAIQRAALARGDSPDVIASWCRKSQQAATLCNLWLNLSRLMGGTNT